MSFILSLPTDYGPVIRFEYDYWIEPYDPPREWPLDGEWRPLEHSSYMLSQSLLIIAANATSFNVTTLVGQRFGYRSRPYTAHAAKLLSSPLVHELTSGVFRDAFQETSRHPFRGMQTSDSRSTDSQSTGQYDAHLGYLFGNFVVERWREALLWTWVVAKIGGSGTGKAFFEGVAADGAFKNDDDDKWETDLHGRRAWVDLGGDELRPSLEVTLSRRDTVDFRRVDHTLNRSATSGPVGTAYTFCEWFTLVQSPEKRS